MFLRFLFALTTLCTLAYSEPISLVTKALKNEKLNAEERKALITLVFEEHEKLLQILNAEMPAELKAKATEISQAVTSTPSEDEGVNRLGAAIGWFIAYDQETLTSQPIISRVRQDSPASKAGLKVGDVLFQSEGVKLYHPESRNRFMTLLKIWPSSTIIAMKAKRHNSQPGLDEGVLRSVNFDSAITLSAKPVK